MRLTALLPLLLGGLLLGPTEPHTPPEEGPALPPSRGVVRTLREIRSEEPGPLLVRLRTRAEQMRTGVAPAEEPRLRRELTWLVQALALRRDAAAFPWEALLQEWSTRRPYWFGASLAEAARTALGRGVLPLVRELDQRATQWQMRLVLHEILWELDPEEALLRATRLLFQEKPRSPNDLLHAEFLGRVLVGQPDPRRHPLETVQRLRPLVDELFRRAVRNTGNRLPEYAWRQAIRGVALRGDRGAVPELVAALMAEARNVLARKQALLSLLEVAPDFTLREVLPRLQADPAVEPVWAGFLEEIRRRYGPAEPAASRA